MALPNTKVFIAFNLSSLGGQYFTLNDTVKGVLNNTTYPLVGDTYVDVTSYVRDVSVNRGASRELEGFQTGQASVTLNNHTRIFDPYYSAGTYYGQLVPKKKFKITSNDITVFTGTIDDWNLSYDVSGDSLATITCSDGFNYFSNTLLNTFTNTQQLSGARISAILNRTEVNWPIGDRKIDTGNSIMRADVVAQDTEVLGYLQTVAQSENANLFMDKSNLVVFDDASTIINRTTTPLFSDDDQANSIPYTNIEVVYGTENLYNKVSVTNISGIQQTKNDTTSQNAYGISAYSISGLLLTDDASANQLATKILGIYKDPELRVNSIVIDLNSLSPTDQSTILNFELATIVKVLFTPNQIGSAIDQYLEIIGINHSLSPDNHSVSLFFRSIGTNPFILNDILNGRLAIYAPASYDDSAYQYNSSTALYDGVVTFGYQLGA